MKSKDEYIESLAAELKEWSAQIDVLSAKAENAAEHAKLKYAEEIEALRGKQRAAAEKIKELEEAGGDAWVVVKETADKVWDELRTGISGVASKFK
ncbi:coiled coil domain-containing protein [Methylococcus sp. EFPC2]|uniref:coiled coil domain-containing protein n=1 Tax=Methylococcus sp. EFPC2 TaxID=2812648 RepID=UPI00196746AA|nr:coiled coil domain-containing protein [Methylococcus sp. EFPC2]QSA98501.1 coiled coil domain-containing protein [Methylococcus sp. EFPC2]